MNGKKVPEGTIIRLFTIVRELNELKDVGIHTVSSAELGERTNSNDAQVRKDLAYFGQFGKSGAGYKIDELKQALEKILGKNKIWNVVIVGIGHMGLALLSYPGFEKHGLNIVSAVDANKRKINKKINDITIKSFEDLHKEIASKKISIGIIAVPAKHAQEVAIRLVCAGIKCILNFAPCKLTVPFEVKVKNVDLSRELETLSYYLVNPVRGRKKN